MGEQIPRAYLELEGLVQRKRQELLVRAPSLHPTNSHTCVRS